MQYQIKRGTDVIATVTPTGKLSKKVMGEDIAPMTFSLPYNIDFLQGDYCMAFGYKYKLKSLSDLKKSSSIEFDYTLNLKGPMYDLQEVLYKFPDANNEYTLTGQSLMGDINTFIDLLITNANAEQSGWVKGVIDEADFQNLTFNPDDNCLSVLATIADAFKTEWWVDGQTIHMTKKGVVEDINLKVGQSNGLYSLNRTTSTEKSLVTRLFCYGSERNIPANYKGFSNRLKLPGTTPYLESNVYVNNDPLQGKKYGVIEGTQVFEDIYPRRLGLVTEVADKITFTDSEIDFNVNTQLLGVSAKVQFQTGNLAGYTFDINGFNNTTKQFTLKYNQDDKDFVLPSDDIKPAVGDQYILLDIAMPDTYITAAENEVLARGLEYLSQYSNPVLQYSVECDQIDFERKNITPSLGNFVTIQDDDFKLNQPIRITALTRDFQFPYQYTLELADTVTINPIQRDRLADESMKKNVERIGKTSNRAYNDALQAKSTAEGVKQITDFWGVTLDSEHGIVASGTLLVGSGPVNNAGITGVIDAGVNSVRFWAGAPYEDKADAPFRVLDNGHVVMTQADISGIITATSGKIGNFTIDGMGLSNVDGSEAYIKQVTTFGDGHTAQFYVGLQLSDAGDGYALAKFLNDKVGDVSNRALVVRASGATVNNHAIEATGDIVQVSGKFVTNGRTGEGTTSTPIVFVYKGSDGDNYYFKVCNGIIYEHGTGTGS
ncbi:hypothetical protein AB6735_18765 [Mucilaginibacter sp. RCC_168]|uniref:hypothetical protein n=1 Tax=Mucilaginibacter sp. RCC_168 TaxID=3239221 RepID=UPI00352569FA